MKNRHPGQQSDPRGRGGRAGTALRPREARAAKRAARTVAGPAPDANAVREPGAVRDPGAVGSGGPEGPTTGAQQEPASAQALPDGYASLAWIQIEPDPLNPRKHFDEEALAELATSIERDGLLENLVVRPGVVPDVPVVHLDGQPAPIHRLVAGERRWRAIGLLIEGGVWPRDVPIVCKIADIDDAAHRRIALVENLQRKDLKPLEEGRALRELMDATGVGTAEIAAEIGFTQRWVQQRLQLLELPAIKQVELERGAITIEDARRWIAAQPKPLQLGSTAELVLLEVAWRASSQRPADMHARVLIGLGHPKQPPEAHPGAPLLHFERTDDGRCWARFANAGWAHLKALAAGRDPLHRDVLDPALRRVRNASFPPATPGPERAAEIDGLFKSNRHMTAWLNPPFDIDEAHLAEVRRSRERERAEIARQAEQRAQAERERKARDERDAEIRVREERMGAAIRLFERRAAEDADIRALTESLMLTLGYEAPFSVAWDGQQVLLQDSAGTKWQGSPELLEGLRRIMALAVNHMLGLPLTSGPELPDTPWAIRAREAAEDAQEPEEDDPQLDLEDAVADAQPQATAQ